MKYSLVAFVSAVLVSAVAGFEWSEIGNVPHQFEAYSLVDPIVKNILEQLRPKLKDLTIPNVNETVRTPNLNGTFQFNDVLIQNLDKFEIANLKSNLVPLKLANLTLIWRNVTARARYNVDATFSISNEMIPINVVAKGDASALLNNVFFTIGANIELKNSVIRIKPKGLFGFDLNIDRATVRLSSLLGSPQLGDRVGALVSRLIPEMIDIFKHPLFDLLQDNIIKILNDVLRKGSNYDSQDFYADSGDLSIEMEPFSIEQLNIDSEENNSHFDF